MPSQSCSTNWDNMPTFSIKTLGCKVNQYESQLIRENFLKTGFHEVNGKKPADIYVINTCTVTERADKDSRHFIRHAHNINPNAKIVVTGCLAENDADMISKIEGVTDIVKNSGKNNLISLITDNSSLKNENFISGFKGHTKAFVKIQDGCDNFCSFCKVPLVRGRSRSRPLEDIKKEVAALLKNGFKEIVLSGICLGEWGRDFGNKLELADAIEALEGLYGEFRIRLSSIELKYISDRLIEKMATSPKLCRHLHIPLQSGDNRILKAMKRPYAREEYLARILKVKSLIPEIGVTTDVLVGFPGEDNDSFDATLGLVREFAPHRIHIFSYSPREGTKAASLKGIIPADVIKERMGQLSEITKELSYGYRKIFLKKEVEILVENKRDKITQLLTGYTDTYIKVLSEGGDSLKGNLLRCKISEVTAGYTFAKA